MNDATGASDSNRAGSRLRDVGIAALVMIVAIYLHGPLGTWWFRFAIEGTPFDYPFAVIELLWGMAIGVAIALLVRSPRFMAWALCCGILGTLYLLASITDHFYPETPISAIIWAKVVYPMPILGAGIGACVAGLARKSGP